ncbi:hypothetical protein KEK_00175 [Mycolicibacterium thermoresistibile ATCC 19527]|uniref:Uncharacterized protein n=1 Tax=Mycolicibacterium thermoresistibile (strain ATCC 19527 / DSM 44167 / CIP 105390 / JCM 6362 / NCTC 10409 / 316) TaxID=1078020 RepID=G7CAP3_MYCT3|nr:hypothetical protein KEK_00175 [Mycolicibacterium thermoresistibile ATCC 19527]
MWTVGWFWVVRAWPSAVVAVPLLRRVCGRCGEGALAVVVVLLLRGLAGFRAVVARSNG